jgi:hypothetical protein
MTSDDTNRNFEVALERAAREVAKFRNLLYGMPCRCPFCESDCLLVIEVSSSSVRTTVEHNGTPCVNATIAFNIGGKKLQSFIDRLIPILPRSKSDAEISQR